MAVTLRQIAKHLNLSHATVSFVLNDRRDVAIPESTRQRVLEMARELGYRPNRAAQALVKGRSNILGVWIPSIRHQFYAAVMDQIADASRCRGYEALYHQVTRGDAARPFEWPIDGVIAVDAHDMLSNEDARNPMPIVSAGAFVDERFDYVQIDLSSGARAAVEHLIHEAGPNVLLVKSGDRRDGRDVGYDAALAKFGAEPNVVCCHGNDPVRVRQVVREHVRRRGLPNAIFGVSDSIAWAAERGMAELGYLAPRDYVLCGFDGTALSELIDPPMTTVRQPVAELAEASVEMLLRRIADPLIAPQASQLGCELLVRGTSRRELRIVETA